MKKILSGKITVIVATVTLCCFLLWSGGSIISAMIAAVVVMLYIILPGIYLCLHCGFKDCFFASSMPVGITFFVLIYSAYMVTDISSLFYALPPLIGAMGFFTLYSNKEKLNFANLRFLSLPVIVFSLSALSIVALPVFALTPTAPQELYAAAVSLVEDHPAEQTIYNILAIAICELTGISGYSFLAFYLPIFSLVMLCVSLYSLADRILKNSRKALLATAIFLLASPFAFPGFEGGFFTAEALLTSGEFTLSLAVAASVILAFERGLKAESCIGLIPAVIGYALLCFIRPEYAGIMLCAIAAVVLIFTATKRYKLKTYLLFLVCSLLFAMLCYDFYTTIAISDGLPQGLQMDGLLRQSYIESPILYYVLLPIGFAVSVFFALLPIITALIKQTIYSTKRLKSTGFASLMLIAISTFSVVAAFIIDGSYGTLSSLALLCGAIISARMFGYPGLVVKATVIASVIIGAFNLSFLMYDGISAQLQSFGYIEQAEVTMVEPAFYEATQYIRKNTPNESVIATNHPLEGGIASAYSDRVFIKNEDFFKLTVTAERMQNFGIDYIMFYDTEIPNLGDVTVLYEQSGYTIVGR